MRWHSMWIEALPAFVPRVIAAEYLPTVRSELKRQGYRCLGRYSSRDVTMWVPGLWYWFARLELFLQGALYFAVSFLIRQGFLRSAVEGDFFCNFRFDPPDLWGTPVRRHERYESYAR